MRLPFWFCFTGYVLLSIAFVPAGAWSMALVEDADETGLEVVVVTGVRVGDGLELSASQIAATSMDNGDLLRLLVM